MSWYYGMPPAKAIAAHESDHPREDGIRLGRITVSRSAIPQGEYVKCDDRSYGEWVIQHPMRESIAGPPKYVSIGRFRVVNGEVIREIGFSQWMPLAEMIDADACRYYPVAKDGLPVDYVIPELRK